MAAPKKARRREAQIGFEALSIEGGLLSADWLARVAQLSAGGQTEADYGVLRGLNLRDEIGRYWRIAQAHWNDFASGRTGGADPKALAERFVLGLLRDSFGFASLQPVVPVVIGEWSYPIGFSALGGRVPVVIAAAATGLDSLAPAASDGVRRRSAFGLTQEFLNAADGAMWGLATDGTKVRIVRDNASLTRPAWIEADLSRIFTEERYSDFAALWLLAHESRFGRAEQSPEDCPLETWRNAGREEGTRAREHLRRGVEDALVALGQGFLGHRENHALRADLQSGALTAQEYFNQLLRLVYRMIFLLTVEERALLHPGGAADSAKKLYAEGYSLKRLRERSAKRSAHDRFSDLWEATKVVFRGVATGESQLGLPALAGIFSKAQCPVLDAARLENRALLLAVFRLSWLREDSGLARVNWRDMGPEELGSVYESLLELVPQLADDGQSFAFATISTAKGSARKESGSYYTKDSLVQTVLDGALEPVVSAAIAKHLENPVEALLRLSVVDSACGSGHFLLSAARRIAAHVARLRTAGTPSLAEYRHALREVVAHCVYGVDLNPMAVELCKVALWMEAVEPGLPLTFLDSHIVLGNALLGTTRELMADGIPDAAWDAIEGDDKATASTLKKQSRHEADSAQRSLLPAGPIGNGESLVAQVRALEASPDSDVAALLKKEELWGSIVASEAYKREKFVADAWCSAFAWPKQPGTLAAAAPTNASWRAIRDGAPIPPLTAATVQGLSHRFRFFHWQLAFPLVFANGGFDVIVGNPPWDALSPDAKEFFSQWDTAVRFQSPDDQRATIDHLRADPAIGKAWEEHCRMLYSSVAFMKNSGRYTLFAPGNLGKGDFNAYRMFVETALHIVRPGGRVSQIVPEGLYNGANCMKIREELFDRCAWLSVLGFENHRHAWFESVHAAAKFAIYLAAVPGTTSRFRTAFNIRSERELRLAMEGATLEIPVSLVREFSPDALALMELNSQTDVDIAVKMYANYPKLGTAVPGLPHREYMREVDMGNDRGLFRVEGLLGAPVYEGRMVSRYDHRAKGYRAGRGRKAEWVDLPFSNPHKSIQAQWFVPIDRIPEKVRARYMRHRIGFCDVASPTNERTLVSTLIPPGCLCGDKVPTITFNDKAFHDAVWIGVANSYVVDFLARKKVSLKMSYTLLDSLPFPRLVKEDSLCALLVPRVAKLVCTGPEMIAFWNQLADEGWVEHADTQSVPGELDEERRDLLEADIEACVAKEIYGLTRTELSYILDTFPIVRRRDEEVRGEYRTKRLILEAYDSIADSARGSQRMPMALAAVSPHVSAALRLVPTHDPSSGLVALPGGEVLRPVQPKRLDRYKTSVPRLDLRAAAGAFGAEQSPEFEDWVEIRASRTLKKGMFVAQVVGRSMEPLIPDGAFCLFERKAPAVRQDMLALFELSGDAAAGPGGRYTVKKLHMTSKGTDEEGERAFTLLPLNPTFEPIEVTEENVRFVAEFVEVLGPLDGSDEL